MQFAGRRLFQAGDDAIERVHIVVVEEAVDAAEIFTFRLADEIFQFAVAVIGVHGHERGADAGGGEHHTHPVRHVGGPERDLFAGLYAQRHQASCQPVDRCGKLAPRLPEIVAHIDEGLSVRKTGYGLIQHLTERTFLKGKIRHIRSFA